MSDNKTTSDDALDAAQSDARLYGCGFLMVHPDGRFEWLPTKAVSLDMTMIKAARANANYEV